MRVVATAGHVDHGKSTLVQALTGTDPDRWPEEKARGLTIDLGFAATALPSGQEIAFVDVPGHGRFVRNMLAGVGSVDACLFVVAATEGWKEQSEEHLRILQLLGVSSGMVALTKVGLVEREWVELVTLEVEERVAGTFLAGTEIIPVDVPAGLGVDELRAGLDRLVGRTPAARDVGRPRLWVDRSFAMRGAGTVVTGTLTGGAVAVDDEVLLLPGGQACRVRGLQSHHSTLEQAAPGRRLAVNLNGVSHHDVRRGHVVVRPGQWHLTRRFDASLSVLESVEHPVERRGAYTVHVGSDEIPVRIRILGPSRIEPGGQAAARYWVQGRAGVALMPGDRYVLREAGRWETVGGGEVLDVDPVLPASRAAPSHSVERVVRERGWVDAAFLEVITGQRIEPTVGRWVVDAAALAAMQADLQARCEGAGTAGLDPAALDEHERALLRSGVPGVPGVEMSEGRAVAAALVDRGLSEDARRVLGELEAGKWAPPGLPLSDRGALRELERRGLAVDAGQAWFATSAVEAAVAVLAQLLEEHEEGFTVSQARDALGTSRKHVLPLLSHLDAAAVTRRRGDLRVAGPRLPGMDRP
ncbi:MAG TPA: selenocysteine-specific translation elongation factor [Acidimicrobiales bacterium]|nr:selenocysteine-specific translation elongation factor [Acidimicrobiales bacterium]